MIRSIVINKILSFQYRLGRAIGKQKAAQVCIALERTFTTLFGREVYEANKKNRRAGKYARDNLSLIFVAMMSALTVFL